MRQDRMATVQHRLGAMENVVRIFGSFEEAEAADREKRALMTPEQRAEIFFQLGGRFNTDAFAKGFARVCPVVELE
jgi:hypothetical protein